MGQLSGHPNIVTVHQAGTTSHGNPYILMAYESGGSLGQRIQQGSAPWQEAVAGGIRLAGALESAHRAGVLHRDVKPENILVSRYGELKLADFGLAQSRRRALAQDEASVLHTAPEILAGGAASVASDIYALGSTVFAWLHGRPAFTPEPGEQPAALFRRVTADPVPDLRPDGVPDAVATVLERAMAKDPEARHASAEEFARALQGTQGAAVTELVIGGVESPWPDEPAGDHTAGPAASLTARAKEAFQLSSTIQHRPQRRRQRRVARVLGAAGMAAAVLATSGSQLVESPVLLDLPVAVEFGRQELSGKLQDRNVTVANPGDSEVRIAAVSVRGPHHADFPVRADTCSGKTLRPRTSCDVTLTFDPKGAGNRTAALNLTVGRTLSTQTAALAGSGLHRFAAQDSAPAGRCYEDAYQVGKSAYGHRGGLVAISVKQYWSPGCRAAMGYVWIWKQYRDQHRTWRVTVGTGTQRQPGAQEKAQAAGQPLELWTEPVPSGDLCTTVTASLADTGPDQPTDAVTAAHCP